MSMMLASIDLTLVTLDKFNASMHTADHAVLTQSNWVF
jgi:hypothetical protein